MESARSLSDELQRLITDEVMIALGLGRTHWVKPIVHLIIRKGTRHFADICAQLDVDVMDYGISEAIRRFLPNFICGCYYYGANSIPTTGPLLVTANHPGAADVMTILALVNRNDVHLVLSGVPFATALSHAQKHFIYVTPELTSRSLVIRDIINYLRAGKCVFIFPTGHVTPDPEIIAETASVFEDWSESIALILRRVPETNLLMTVVSGVIEKRFLDSPICKLRKIPWRQQILAEFMQITWQMLHLQRATLQMKHPSNPTITPRVTFMTPIKLDDLLGGVPNVSFYSRHSLHQAILDHAAEGLMLHNMIRQEVSYLPYPK